MMKRKKLTFITTLLVCLYHLLFGGKGGDNWDNWAHFIAYKGFFPEISLILYY